VEHHSEGYLKLRKVNTGIIRLKPQTLNTDEKLQCKQHFQIRITAACEINIHPVQYMRPISKVSSVYFRQLTQECGRFQA
jgi:hypothetical protein